MGCLHGRPGRVELKAMPLLLVLIGLFVPRLTLLVAMCAGAFDGVWRTLLWPVLGFIFLPYTTLTWGLAHAYGSGIEGIWLVVLIFAVLLDFGSTGSASRARKRKRRAGRED